MDIKELQPEYKFNINEDVILLENETVELISEEKKIQCTANIIFSLKHKANLYFKLSGERNLYEYGMKCMRGETENESSIRIIDRNIETGKGFFTNVQFANLSELHWEPAVRPFSILGSIDTEVDYISFYMLNGIEFLSLSPSDRIECEYPGQNISLLPYRKLEWKDWQIEFIQIISTQNLKKLRTLKGNAITHIGIIEKSNSSVFNINDFKQIEGGLYAFLDFCIGRECWPSIFSGYKGDEKVYEQFGDAVKTYSYINTCFSCIDSYAIQIDCMEQFFPLFMDKWNNDNWKSTLREAIYWILNSNTSKKLMLQQCLLLHQAGMELLSFEYIVNDKQIKTPSQFSRLRASDQFRELFEELNIPLELTDKASAICKSLRITNIDDIPHLLTEIRNSIVHPNHRHKGKVFGEPLYEVWKISMEYLELSILAICGYNRNYQSRIEHSIKLVPWA